MHWNCKYEQYVIGHRQSEIIIANYPHILTWLQIFKLIRWPTFAWTEKKTPIIAGRLVKVVSQHFENKNMNVVEGTALPHKGS